MHLSPILPPSLTFFLTYHALADPIPAVSTITVSSPPQPTSTSYISDSAFQNTILTAHNFFRSEHNVSALTWNDTSTKYAANWASQCKFAHTGGPTGENLAAGYTNATAAVDGWALEREDYDFKKPTGFSEKTGHFTQVVWGNTTSVGCARSACNGKNKTPGYYIVCEYFPPGNVGGNNNQYYKDNVKPQIKGLINDTVESGVQSSKGCSLRPGDGGAVVLWVTGFPVVWLLYNLAQIQC